MPTGKMFSQAQALAGTLPSLERRLESELPKVFVVIHAVICELDFENREIEPVELRIFHHGTPNADSPARVFLPLPLHAYGFDRPGPRPGSGGSHVSICGQSYCLVTLSRRNRCV